MSSPFSLSFLDARCTRLVIPLGRVTASGWCAVLLCLACAGESPSDSGEVASGGNEAAGSGGAGFAVGGGAALAAGGSEVDGAGGEVQVELGIDGYPMECPEVLVLDPDATEKRAVSLSLENAGAAFEFGEYNSLSGGGTVLPTNLRFYLSQFAFYQGDERVPASLVNAEGVMAPYGVQLVNAEDPTSFDFTLASPSGSFDGISFLLGLSEGCNQAFRPLDPPLDEASQLKWPHTLGFLFLRFEGQLSEEAASLIPDKIHMGRADGDDGLPPLFRLNIPASDTGPLRLSFDFDAMLNAAATETDLSDFALPPPAPPTIDEEIYAGERLRRAAHSVEIFIAPVGG